MEIRDKVAEVIFVLLGTTLPHGYSCFDQLEASEAERIAAIWDEMPDRSLPSTDAAMVSWREQVTAVWNESCDRREDPAMKWPAQDA